MQERIKRVRRETGLTQQEFADRIGLQRNTIAGYETGVRVPSNAAIISMAREFDVDETWLRTGEGDMFRDDDEALMGMADKIADEMERSDVFRSILRTYLTLPEADRDIIERFINAFVDDVTKNPAHSAPDFEELMRRAQEESTEDKAE